MENIVAFIGAFLKHLIGVLLLCWRRMLRAGLIAFAIGVVLVMLVAVIATGQAYPGALALVVALIFGGALAYGIALTVFIEEFLLGVVDLIKLLEGDVKGVAHLTATVAEREVGDVGHGLRRLIGLPVAASPAPPVPAMPALPTLPTLPRYPTAPARPAPRPDALAREAALAGGASLLARAASAASAPSAPSAARPPQATVAAEPSAPIEPAADTQPAHPPTGEPVRADRLPRIGWTYEHEAIRPTRATPLPDTLAELAGVAVAGAGGLLGGSGAQAASEPPAADTAVVVTPNEPEPVAPESLDVAVVVTPTPSAPEPATSATEDDVSPLDDDRLAEPLALTLPDDEAVTLASDTQAPPDPSLDPPLDPAMLNPASATTPLIPEAEPAAEPTAEPTLDPAMLAPAPATTPLYPEDAPLDPVMLSLAPATTPLHPADAPLDPAMLAPAPATTPFVRKAEPLAEEQVAPAVTPAVASAEREQPVSQDASAEPAPTPEAAPEAAPVAPDGTASGDATTARMRSALSRITRPVAGLGTALDAINRVAPNTEPRASAPESGLWERLSQALIDRAGAPSSPFAAPQARPASPSVSEDASEDAGGASAPGEASETPQG